MKIFMYWFGDKPQWYKDNLTLLKSNNIDVVESTLDEHDYLMKHYKYYRSAFDSGKFAFTADVWRYWKAIDNDVFYFSNPSILLTQDNVDNIKKILKNNEYFVCSESKCWITSAYFYIPGGIREIRELCKYYRENNFVAAKRLLSQLTAPQLFTACMTKRGIFSNLKSKYKNIIIRKNDLLDGSSNSVAYYVGMGTWHKSVSRIDFKTVRYNFIPKSVFFEKLMMKKIWYFILYIPAAIFFGKDFKHARENHKILSYLSNLGKK